MTDLFFREPQPALAKKDQASGFVHRTDEPPLPENGGVAPQNRYGTCRCIRSCQDEGAAIMEQLIGVLVPAGNVPSVAAGSQTFVLLRFLSSLGVLFHSAISLRC